MLPLPGHRFSTVKAGSGSFESPGSQVFSWIGATLRHRAGLFIAVPGPVVPLEPLKNVSAAGKFCVCREATDDCET